jgi:large subunit ribosomal protein L31
MCGNSFETRSTAGEHINLEVCSVCHPFYTGRQRIVDSGGRVQRFQDRLSRQNEQ